jgi:type III secretion protein U
MSEKTEQPTPKKLQAAREEGQMPLSRVLSGGAVTLAGLMALGVTLPWAAGRLRAWTVVLLSGSVALPTALQEGGFLFIAITLGPAMAVLFAAIAASAVQAGFGFRPVLVSPRLDRIGPFQGLRQLFSFARVTEVARGGFLVVLLLVVAWNETRGITFPAFASILREPRAGFGILLERLQGLMLRLAAICAALGVADYLLARRRHRRQLRMSKEEVRKEHRQAEGDPHHKARRKAFHRQLVDGGPARGLPKATALLVNPTHIAVGLRFDERECSAPYVVAKGQDGDALALRREATAAGIPIVKDIPLARSLICFDVGEAIPEELYVAAAVVLRMAKEQQETGDQPWGLI